MDRRQTDRLTDTLTDTNRFYNRPMLYAIAMGQITKRLCRYVLSSVCLSATSHNKELRYREEHSASILLS